MCCRMGVTGCHEVEATECGGEMGVVECGGKRRDLATSARMRSRGAWVRAIRGATGRGGEMRVSEFGVEVGVTECDEVKATECGGEMGVVECGGERRDLAISARMRSRGAWCRAIRGVVGCGGEVRVSECGVEMGITECDKVEATECGGETGVVGCGGERKDLAISARMRSRGAWVRAIRGEAGCGGEVRVSECGVEIGVTECDEVEATGCGGEMGVVECGGEKGDFIISARMRSRGAWG